MRKQENNKVFIIVLSDALTNPNAVMIESTYNILRIFSLHPRNSQK